MSTKTVFRAAPSLVIVTAAACSDAIAPKLERVQSQIANALTCTVTWVAPVSGLWTEGGKWSTGTVPTAADNVCITAEGNYTVTLRDMSSVNSMTVSMPGNADKPKLVIEGFNLAAGFGSSTGRLTVANGFDNYGFVHMTNTGPFPGPSQLIVTNGQFHNHDVAEFRVLPGTTAGRLVQAHVVNDGGMVFETPTSGFLGITNNALFVINAGVNIASQAITFTQAGGTFANDGAYNQTTGTFRLDGGALTGNPPIVMGVAVVIGSETALGTLAVRGQSTLTGNVGANQVIQIEGWQLAAGWNETPANLTFASAFTNAGIIRLTSTGGPMNGSASLTGPASVAIVNTGRIEVLAGLGNIRAVNANIDNRETGVVDMQVSTRYGQQDGMTTNAGTWKVASGTFVTMANAIKFIQNGGTFDVAGAWHQSGGGEFQLNGGTITGEPFLNNVAIKIAPGSTATGSLLTIGSTLTGDVQPGQKITVTGWPATSGALRIPASITNRGTIVMTTIGTQDPGQAQLIMQNGSTITNAASGRIEMLPGSLETSGRIVQGDLVNEGTIHLAAPAFFTSGTLRTSGPITGTDKQLRLWTTTYATGTIAATVRNEGAFHVGASTGAAGALSVTNFWMPGGGSFNVDIGGSVAGTDFDQLTATEWASIGAGTTLNVSMTAGGCAGGGSSYDVIRTATFGGNFDNKTGLNLGNGRTATAAPGPDYYRISVSGPVCVPPDATAPVIAPTVTGTLGNNGWYTSDVSVTWSVTDAESAIGSKTGCDDAAVTSDNAGVTYTCSATSAGGTATQSVTIKRDATPPVISTSQSPMPNANGWNNTDVTAFWSATDAMSGLAGAANMQNTFNGEGIRMNFGGRYFDKAGNVAVALIFASIDRTKPTVTASRAPAANASGWNNTDVVATYSATDGLSGIDGSASATRTFGVEGANQDGSYLFTDLAGNSAKADVGDVSIDKTAPTVTIIRDPMPDATGWNSTDVTVTATGSDALSGMANPAFNTHTFTQNGAGQIFSGALFDRAGNIAPFSATININKAPPPPPPNFSPSCSVTPNDIWPPNNKMVAVQVTISGSGLASYTLLSVTNNESGSADVDGWTIGGADLSGSVRASRNGGGNGRTYTLAYEARSTSGAVTQCAVTVRVPHDQGKK